MKKDLVAKTADVVGRDIIVPKAGLRADGTVKGTKSAPKVTPIDLEPDEPLIPRVRRLTDFGAWWDKASIEARPIMTPTLKIDRDYKSLQMLALSENERSMIALESHKVGTSGANLKTGAIYLALGGVTNDFKKIVTMHEAGHLSITPQMEEMTKEDRKVLKEHHLLVNAVEDVRVNRYLCLKYDGLLRYFKEELTNEKDFSMQLCVGDLIGDEVEYPAEYKNAPLIKMFLKHLRQIRGCKSFEDVIDTVKLLVGERDDVKDAKMDSSARKLGAQMSFKVPGYGAEGDAKESGSGDEGEEKDSKGKGKEEKKKKPDMGSGSMESEEEIRKMEELDKLAKEIKEHSDASDREATEMAKKMLEAKGEDDVLKTKLEDLEVDTKTMDEPEAKKFDVERMLTDDSRKHSKAKTLISGRDRWEKHSDDEIIIKHVEKPESFFLRKDYRFEENSKLSKNLVKDFVKKMGGKRASKDGRLGKIDPVRMKTSKKIFNRSSPTETVPKTYLILDCSGSMGKTRMNWLKSLAMPLIRLLDEIGAEYELIAHTGSWKTLEWSRIQAKNFKDLCSHSANLDGSMLEELIDKIIPKKEKCVVYYFSDGGFPVEHAEVEAPKLVRALALADMHKIPIFGVGLQTVDVMLFQNWYVVTDKSQFPSALREMFKNLRKFRMRG